MYGFNRELTDYVYSRQQKQKSRPRRPKRTKSPYIYTIKLHCNERLILPKGEPIFGRMSLHPKIEKPQSIKNRQCKKVHKIEASRPLSQLSYKHDEEERIAAVYAFFDTSDARFDTWLIEQISEPILGTKIIS